MEGVEALEEPDITAALDLHRCEPSSLRAGRVAARAGASLRRCTPTACSRGVPEAAGSGGGAMRGPCRRPRHRPGRAPDRAREITRTMRWPNHTDRRDLLGARPGRTPCALDNGHPTTHE